MANVDWNTIKIDEIFPEDRLSTENQSSIPVAPPRNKLNFKKNHAAPLPPGQPRKFGNYIPKMYDGGDKNNEQAPVSNKEAIAASPVHSGIENGNEHSTNPSYVLIGDKHNPLIIGPTDREETHAKSPRSPKEHRNKEIFSDIPDKVAMGFDAQDRIFNFGETVTNPLFDEVPVAPPRRNRKHKEPSSPVPIAKTRRHRLGHSISSQSPERETLPSNEKGDYPYIPTPDYDLDDSEVTLTLHDSQVVETSPKKSLYLKKNRRIYKEFDGNDFGQYLSDDEDYEFDTVSSGNYTWRTDIRYKQKPPPERRQQQRRSSEVCKLPSQSKMKNSSGKDLKPSNKSKSKDSGRNTIRNFSFAHSKLAGGDRTVKSTSALGRQAKSKERPRLQDNLPTESYEAFLRTRNGDDGSLESNDSGLEMDDAMRYKMFERNQPRQLKNHNHHKDSLWQKLTWKFRKNVSVYDMGDR